MTRNKLPLEVTVPEHSFKQGINDHVKRFSTYIVEGMFFDFDWSTGELIYEGFRDTEKLMLKEEHMVIFGRKSMRGFTYLRFGINRETHELTLRIV